MKRNLRLSWVRTPGGLEMKWTVEIAPAKAPRRGAHPGAAEPVAANDRPKRASTPRAWAARAAVLRPAS
jgi:hypothetical protein